MSPSPTDFQLFPEPDAQAHLLLEEIGRILNKVSHLRSRHRADLAYAIRDLSRSLTEERDGRPRDYMGEPRMASAYLRYFLPWNLYRLTRLFQGLDLSIPEGATVVDLGAGPLTALLALWISRPHLRERKLNFVCVDRTPKPMRTGLEIFKILAPKSPWKITLVKGGVHTKLRERADLLLCANTLNELDWHGGEAIYEQAEHTARSLTLRVNPGGRMLLVEPGVRDAARILSILRQEFLQSGFSPIAPCPHMGDCPMPASGNGPWCHFRFDAASAPQWLKAITLEAKLTKQATSLSFLFLAQDKFLEKGLVRVISESFRVPEGMGQYGCSDHGLTLLGYKYGYAPFNPGDTLRPVWPAEELRDEKSGGLILPVTPNGPKPPVSKRPPATEAEEQRPEERQPERLPPESGAAKATGRDGRRPENKRPKSAQRTRKPREDKGGPGTKRPRKPAPSKGAPKRGK